MKSIMGAVLAVTALGGGRWQQKYDWPDLLFCPSGQYMTGLCAAGATRDCYASYWTAGKIKCDTSEDSVSPHERRWVVGTEHGTDIECNLDLDETAVGACTSGRYKDCRCNGGASEGCDDNKAWHSHILQCAKGALLKRPLETVEVSYAKWGVDAECPDGYVVYKICASGMNQDCTNNESNDVSHKIKCVKTRLKPKATDPDRTFEKTSGYWHPINNYNDVHTYEVAESRTDAYGTIVSQEESKLYSFSQELSVEVRVDVAALGTSGGGVSTTGTIGAEQEFGKTIIESVEKSWEVTSSTKWTRMCPSVDKPGSHSLYQWYWHTTTKDGNKGPSLKTKSFICTPGHFNDPGVDTPRCVPGNCMNDDICHVCKYDFCKIEKVIWEGDKWWIPTKCFDLFMGNKTWGTGRWEVEHSRGDPTHHYDKSEGGIFVLGKGAVQMTRDDGTGKNMDGLTSARWLRADEVGPKIAVNTTKFQVGDRIRILKVLPFPSGRRRSVTEVVQDGFLWVGAPAFGVAVLALTFRKWSKTHTEVTDELLA